MNLKLRYTDNGYARVYYHEGRYLYCLQYEGAQGMKFYTCSRDGEPCCEARPPANLPPPTGTTLIDRQVRAWLARRDH